MKDLKYDYKKAEVCQVDKFHELLRVSELYSTEEVEAMIHALVDIAESIEKVYVEIIPNILNTPNICIDNLKDKIWDIREEFRHINYHIKDAKLTEL